jgi:mono/diheme cytochrome c family protein
MHLIRGILVGVFVAISAWGAEPAPAPKAARPAHPLVWDAMEKTIPATVGATETEFRFSVTNKGDQPVQIHEIRTSCGCTVAEMPQSPWILAPGGEGSFRATVDIRGRRGKFAKSMLVVSAAGPQVLGVIVDIPEAPQLSREQRMQVASGDRQAVFRGACYECHVAPIGGKEGIRLYQAACTICHEAEPRATMVPDLMIAREHRDEAWWRKWITEGKENTLMPGFGEKLGGPLSERQIDSLVEYLVKHMPTEPAKN